MSNTFNFSKRTCTQVNIGLDFITEIAFTDKDDTPIDLTGFSVDMRIREHRDDTDLLTLSIIGNQNDTGFYIADLTSGLIRMKIARVDSATFTGGEYLYDIILTDPSDNKSIFMEGTILFTQGVI